MLIKQSTAIHNFNKECRPDFNSALFERNEDNIIHELQNVILSCQRDSFFTIKVLEFEVITDWFDINAILKRIEDNIKPKGNQKKINQYDYVNIKDTALKLLRVRYYVSIKEKGEEAEFDVYIAVPRIVDKYYFKIAGNTYSALYQIVDGSTYNNLTSSSSANKKHKIVLKTMFMPIQIYKSTVNLLLADNTEMKSSIFSSLIFTKYLPVMKYFLARFGLYETFNIFEIPDITITKTAIDDENIYSFMAKYAFINVPKIYFDNDPVTQSLISTLYFALSHKKKKVIDLERVYTREFWMESLSTEFNIYENYDKAISVLNSLETIYDIGTMESIHLPMEDKGNVYLILRWMMREFTNLRNKDNLDISTKRIRFSKYIAALYASKISTGIYRIADRGAKATINDIKKALTSNPMYLIREITKSTLVNYRDMVSDLDSMLALKYTYKGTAGLGEKSSKSIPDIYRSIHPSHVGRLDLDSSSNSDPGVTGCLTPYAPLYGDSFSEYEEPLTWKDEFIKLTQEYKKISGMKQIAFLKQDLLGMTPNESGVILSECEDLMKDLMIPAIIFNNESQYSDRIFVEYDDINIPGYVKGGGDTI